MRFRLDRWGWARAVLAEKAYFGLKGIARPSMQDFVQARRRREEHVPWVEFILTSDERYVEDLQLKEAEYMCKSTDYQEDWEEHVKHAVHGEGHCPHSENEEEREAYEKAYARLLNDENKKWQWAWERIDWDWTREQIEFMVDCVEGVWHLLLEHPVEEVYQASSESWLDIEDVVAFCPGCCEPMTASDAQKVSSKTPHPFTEEDHECFDGPNGFEGDVCFFDDHAMPRTYFECPSCGASDFWDSRLDKKPPNWPPGAPWPPRRGFAGEPMDVPFYEK